MSEEYTQEIPGEAHPPAGRDRAHQLARHLEAIIMVAEDPVPSAVLAEVCEVPQSDIERCLRELSEQYERDGKGFVLRKVAGGWRYYSHPDEAPYVETFITSQQSARLSAAALETLAIIAYKQPISRAQLATIRGVNCDAVVRNLVVRGLVEEVGRDHGPGKAVLYGTSVRFLEQMGLSSLEELPPLGQFAPDPGEAERIEEALRTPGEAGTDEAADIDESPGSENLDASE
jgi:segregation and condensation protein B